MNELSPISDYTEAEGYEIMREIMNKIYIARNINLNEKIIIEQLEKIDQLFRTVKHD